MEYTEISAYDIPSGHVTTWSPTAAAAQWHDDDRALSPGHEEHLAGGASGSWIGAAMRVPHAYDAVALRRALAAWVRRHEALRTTAIGTEHGWKRRTAPPAAVEVFATEIGWLPGAHANQRIADTMASLSPLAWPHCAFVSVVDPDEDGFVLVMGADHSVMDAYSQALWPAETVELYRRAAGVELHPEGREWTDRELAGFDGGSHVDHSAAESAYAAALDAGSPVVQRWHDYLGEELRFPRVPAVIVAEAARTDLPQSSLSVPLADAGTTARVAALCKAGGVSVQSGVLGAMSLAFHRRYGVERLRYVLPMHTRMSLEHALAVGWYVGLCPVDVDLAGAAAGTEPDELLLAAGVVQSEVAAQRDLVLAPFARVAELLGVRDTPHFVVSYIDGRFIPGAGEWESWDGRLLRSPAYAGDEFYLWFARTADGVFLNARYPSTLTAERTMRALVADLRDLMLEASAAVGVAETERGVSA